MKSGKFRDTIISVDIDVADYIDINELSETDGREVFRLVSLAREAAVKLGRPPLSLAIRDCAERLEPLLRKLGAA